MTMYQSTNPTVEENLLAVADMIRDKGMLCKEAWSRVEMGKRKGCAEGLLAEQMGLYNGFSKQMMQFTGPVRDLPAGEHGRGPELQLRRVRGG